LVEQQRQQQLAAMVEVQSIQQQEEAARQIKLQQEAQEQAEELVRQRKQVEEQEELARQTRIQEEENKRKEEQQQQQEKEELLKQQKVEINAQNVSLNDSNCSNQAAISSNSSQSMDATTDLSQQSSNIVVPPQQPEQTITEQQPAASEEAKPAENNSELTPTTAIEEASAAVAAELVDENSNGAERSESAIKEVPMSGDRHRFSRSKSPKARWHNENGDLAEADEEQPKQEDVPKASELNVADKDDKLKQEESSANESTTASAATDDLPKVQRKRKWLTNDQAAASILSHKKQLTISSDTLKSYLPAIKDTDDNMPIGGGDAEAATGGEESSDRRVVEADLPEDDEDVEKQETRRVKIEEVTASESSQTNNKQTNGHGDEPLRTITNNLKAEPSGPGGKRVVSNVLHISNLTRPFTVPQLKELLVKFGLLMANEKAVDAGLKEKDLFWINSVKSHCFVAFVEEKSGREAREGLHQITWPQSNPKKLNVEFASMDDLEFVIKHNEMPSMKNHQNQEFPK